MTPRLILGLLAALFLFILPIPGTIALRHSLFVILLGLGAALLFWPLRRLSLQRGERHYLLWLAVLTGWIYAQAGWISDETAWSLREIASQWVPALCAASLGVGLVWVARRSGISRERFFGWLMLLMLAQTVFSLLVTVPDFMANGAFPQGKTRLTAGKLEISYWNNLLMAFLAVDALARGVLKQRLSFLPAGVLAAGMALVFASNVLFGARNGVIGSVLLLLSLLALMLVHLRHRLSIARLAGVSLGLLFAVAALGWASVKLDPRWQTFGETARVAWDIDATDAWYRPGSTMPLLPSGQPAEESAYLRIAWIRGGLAMIHDYPQGVGYGRNAFAHALRKTRDTRVGHAHSGIIDWTIGVGVPGLLLWLGFIGTLAWQGVRRYFVDHDAGGLVLFFVVSGFFGRMFLDSINRDHLLIVFFLLVGVLVASANPSRTESAR